MKTKALVLFMVIVFLVFGGMELGAKGDVEAGWKVFKLDAFSVAFPKDWSGDKETQVFAPGKVDMSMGMPALSVHCGAFPIMPGKTLLNTLERHIHGGKENVKVTIGGLNGYTCTWEYMSKKSIGVFLEEKVGGGMGMMYFVKCQAPKGEFEKYKGTFEKIIKSFHK
ncbi:MAG: hypothetical protein GY765_15500 [bacterium]|nr:hypothetical protein [bacterium]